MCKSTSSNLDLPAFDELQASGSRPKGALWGLFDLDNVKDELGTLNLLTPSVVLEAAKEIKLGLHIQLDWSMKNIEVPGYGRIPMNHTIKDLRDLGFVAFDDEIHINTQTSSQWDSLKHWGIQEQGLFYNGTTHDEAASSNVLGIHTICDRGGIVGRGVLIDWARWWTQTKPDVPLPAANTTHSIPISEIKEAAAFQGTSMRTGDILIVRTGYLAWYNSASTEDRIANVRDEHNFIGLKSDGETVRWLYENHFAAVAGDAMGFEAWPYPKDCCLHEWLLACWGTPIGELWDLEILSKTCADLSRRDRIATMYYSDFLNITARENANTTITFVEVI